LPPTASSRTFPRLLLLLLAVAPAGCGLSGYEKKMQETDARIQRFDEEMKQFVEASKLLGDPVEFPIGEAKPPTPLFLRPPKSVQSKAVLEKSDQPWRQYHCPIPPPATGAAAAIGTVPSCTDVYLLFMTKDDSARTLETNVERWIHATGDWKPYTAQPPNGRQPITFDAAQLGDARAPANAPVSYSVYVHKANNGAPIAVVYRITQPDAAGPAVKASLETYADAEDVSKVQSDYEFLHGHAPAP